MMNHDLKADHQAIAAIEGGSPLLPCAILARRHNVGPSFHELLREPKPPYSGGVKADLELTKVVPARNVDVIPLNPQPPRIATARVGCAHCNSHGGRGKREGR